MLTPVYRFVLPDSCMLLQAALGPFNDSGSGSSGDGEVSLVNEAQIKIRAFRTETTEKATLFAPQISLNFNPKLLAVSGGSSRRTVGIVK
jgi:hypothetical protein